MKKIYRSACPLDCYASCGLLIYTENGRVTGIKGDPEHPLTRGKVCGKARKHLERLYSPERILYPMVKEGSDWRRIQWNEALDIWARKLEEIKRQYGTGAVLYHDASGSNGVLRGLGSRFFNVYGGVSIPEGSLCWASGKAAQAVDFGGHQAHEWDDLENSRNIFLWGRDPGRTNIHLLQYLKRAAAKGARLISVNPVRVQTGVTGTWHVYPRPGTDGALALGMAHQIIAEGLIDKAFVEKYTKGYAEFAALVKEFPPEKVAGICDIPAEEIKLLARTYAGGGPSAIMFGYGMQRYTNSGRTVRCIDALAAITGNIGVPGGGANYVHQHWKDFFTDLSGAEFARAGRTFPWPALARRVMEADDPPVRSIVVTRSNPVTQLPDTNKVLQAFRAVDFVVAIEFFINDTAAEADLFLPCTTFLEDEDVVVSSWNNYVSYMPRVIEPLGESKSDVDIFTALARRMGFLDFGFHSSQEWLERALSRAASNGIDLERLKEGPARNPAAPRIAWGDRKFPTPSGKYELYSEKAVEKGLEPLPTYVPPQMLSRETENFPLYLLTPHSGRTIHSQFWNLIPDETLGSLPAVEMHPQTAAGTGVNAGDRVWVESSQGRLQGILYTVDDIRPGVVRIYQGRWASQNGGVNFLTPDAVSDLGSGSCYYDCRCRVYRCHD
ncbi:MAG: molybdopterin oxidoreductase [Firmicutes bacterium]|nr:molybdopterin oxidoreductase [Bacillota bacterium]